MQRKKKKKQQKKHFSLHNDIPVFLHASFCLQGKHSEFITFSTSGYLLECPAEQMALNSMGNCILQNRI